MIDPGGPIDANGRWLAFCPQGSFFAAALRRTSLLPLRSTASRWVRSSRARCSTCSRAWRARTGLPASAYSIRLSPSATSCAGTVPFPRGGGGSGQRSHPRPMPKMVCGAILSSSGPARVLHTHQNPGPGVRKDLDHGAINAGCLRCHGGIYRANRLSELCRTPVELPAADGASQGFPYGLQGRVVHAPENHCKLVRLLVLDDEDCFLPRP